MQNPSDLFRGAWKQLFDTETEPVLFRPLGGGSINSVWKIDTQEGIFVMKCNNAERYPRMFEAEARGLNLLASCAELRLPEVIGTTHVGNSQVLLLEYLEAGLRQPKYFSELGRALASLHRHTENSFGLDHDNWIGSLPQSNKRHLRFCDFFREERLIPQYNRARESGHLQSSDDKAFEQLCKQLDHLIPEEAPALLHGDLWNGNIICGPEGQACLIDPAAAYSHREAELAMTKLFGGFDPSFYEAYHEVYPLQAGWEDRISLWNLYPLLVHINLFGGGYISEYRSAMRLI